MNNVNTAFNHTSHTHKELLSLKGMLEGIPADSELKEVEVVFLDNWIKDQTHIKKDGDILDLQDTIQDVLEDGVMTGEVRDELTDSEIQTLQKLVDKEPSAHSHWAVKRIKEKVDAVLDDGVIEEHERESLLDDVKAVCGQGFLDTGIASGLSTVVLVGDINFETLNGQLFALTQLKSPEHH
ncbi:hypothetical protein [Vibrio owensii]|uniref:hypothetical protein n=1 Tax=Vibrio owensii TaxID=696485 RepID=UPI002FF16C4C